MFLFTHDRVVLSRSHCVSAEDSVNLDQCRGTRLASTTTTGPVSPGNADRIAMCLSSIPPPVSSPITNTTAWDSRQPPTTPGHPDRLPFEP